MNAKIRDVGEKRLIAEIIRPLFNPHGHPDGVGDDCAVMNAGGDMVLASTDRVPADLIAFRLGILDHAGLGSYLARLNLSDIAACGGQPLGLLLCLGLPPDWEVDQLEALCRSFRDTAAHHGCPVLGGDMTSASEPSIAATAIGRAPRSSILRRSGAKPGDTLFISRPLGLTPAAFLFYLGAGAPAVLSPAERGLLDAQFTSLEPMFTLGQALASSQTCSSCMDNTDGVGQCLDELGTASDVGFVVDERQLQVPELVERIAAVANEEVVKLAFSGGADFSLVGTLKGRWSQQEVDARLGGRLRVIGHVIPQRGVFRFDGHELRPLHFVGWNYWRPE